MPHLRIEYSANLAATADIAALCEDLRQAMIASGVFPLAGIRVRAFKADHAITADAHAQNAFVALILTVGAGRSTETLQAAGQRIFDAAQAALSTERATGHVALSLDIRESNPDLSWKDNPIHARLAADTGTPI